MFDTSPLKVMSLGDDCAILLSSSTNIICDLYMLAKLNASYI